MAKQRKPAPKQQPTRPKPVNIPLRDQPKPTIKEGSGSGNRPTIKRDKN